MQASTLNRSDADDAKSKAASAVGRHWTTCDDLADLILEIGSANGGTLLRLDISLSSSSSYAICLPVKDEEAMLPATLAALAAAAANAQQAGVFVLVVNDTYDQSAELFRQWVAFTGANYILAEVSFPAGSAGAPRARRIALEIAQLAAPDAPLLTTDADTTVGADWITNNLNWLQRGADLVCGQVDVSQVEHASLAKPVKDCGEVEAAYTAALRQLWHGWTGGNAPDPLLSAMGASLAIRPEALRVVGGLPLPTVGEDRALAQLMAEHGFSVVQAADVRVTTSLRLNGRAWGGVSDTLRERAVDQDPLCDEKLLPVRAMESLSQTWLRLAGQPGATASFARLLGADLSMRERMRLSAVRQELRIAEALLQQDAAVYGQAVAAE